MEVIEVAISRPRAVLVISAETPDLRKMLDRQRLIPSDAVQWIGP